MTSPHQVTADFEAAVAAYVGAPWCVAVNSCTNALFLALMWRKWCGKLPETVECPARTYVSVPMQIVHAGARPVFRDYEWLGQYELGDAGIIDSARLFTSGMYRPCTIMCTSHHWGKTLGLQQAGCLLVDSEECAAWLRRARFDGRTAGVAPKDDEFEFCGWHFYLAPEISALGLMRLSLLPKHNAPLPNDDYPDLSKLKIFQRDVAKQF